MRVSKHILRGVFGALLFNLSVFVLGIYFGLGMSPHGAWFVANVMMQPGVALQTLFAGCGLPGATVLAVAGQLVTHSILISIGSLGLGLLNARRRSD